jgi:hypothetical protein
MRFCVNTCIPDPNGTVTLTGRYYTGRYEILDSGALVVTPDDGSEDIVTYSPHFWVSVEQPGPDAEVNVDTSRDW